jgi:hypothetical protein
MPAKKMRTAIKVEDGEGEVEADKGQEEAGGGGREQRRRPRLLRRMRRDRFGLRMRRRRCMRFKRWSRRE